MSEGVFATTLAMIKPVDTGRVGPDQPLSEPIGADLKNKEDLTPRLILIHSAGFVDWKPFCLELLAYPLEKRKAILRERIIF